MPEGGREWSVTECLRPEEVSGRRIGISGVLSRAVRAGSEAEAETEAERVQVRFAGE